MKDSKQNTQKTFLFIIPKPSTILPVILIHSAGPQEVCQMWREVSETLNCREGSCLLLYAHVQQKQVHELLKGSKHTPECKLRELGFTRCCVLQCVQLRTQCKYMLHSQHSCKGLPEGFGLNVFFFFFLWYFSLLGQQLSRWPSERNLAERLT